MDIRDYNRRAWDAQVASDNPWTVPVSAEAIAKARAGEWSIVLTPQKPVPHTWFPTPLRDTRILCLASGGGQQGPILAAAGAHVTVYDNSPAQLERDRAVASREGLTERLHTLEGDMRDLQAIPDASFDLVFHPVSNMFVPDINPVWREAHRVLRPGGALLAGFANPINFLFDDQEMEQNDALVVRHPLPYSDLTHLTEAERQSYIDNNDPLHFGHTLTDQLGGQLRAGFVITDMFEDRPKEGPLARYTDMYLATRALKA